MSIKECARLHYGKSNGPYGSVVCLSALGCASFAIGGYTWMSSINYPRTECKDETKISQETAKKIHAKFAGVRLIIFDEIGMISAKQLRIFDYRLKCGLKYGCSTQLERDEIDKKPYGGIHIVFGGDFWQLDPIGRTYLKSKPDKQDKFTLEGYELWAQLNDYVELLENCRFKDLTASLLAEFNNKAREGNMTEELIARMNAKCLCLTYDEAIEKINARTDKDSTKIITRACRNEEVDGVNKKVNTKLIRLLFIITKSGNYRSIKWNMNLLFIYL